jgi:hypothetical protein
MHLRPETSYFINCPLPDNSHSSTLTQAVFKPEPLHRLHIKPPSTSYHNNAAGDIRFMMHANLGIIPIIVGCSGATGYDMAYENNHCSMSTSEASV